MENLSLEQIQSIEKMIRSDNRDDVILGCQLIYNSKPFKNWRSLTKQAKIKYDFLTQRSRSTTSSWLWVNSVYANIPDNTFLKKILEIPMSKTLYKKDSSGNIRYLKIWTDGDKLCQEGGVVGTDSPVPHEKICKPKNTGKSNATTGEQQAKLEMKSKIAEKLKEDYFEKLEAAKNGQVILPQLAKSYKDEKHKIDWSKPVYVQRKYDGMRCLARNTSNGIQLISRQGTEIENMDHIKEALKDLKAGIILDGELYSKELGGFQQQMKAIKKFRPGITEKIQYHVYDVVDEKPFSLRMIFSDRVFGNPIIKVETILITDEKELIKYHKQFVGEGYEGTILRHSDAGYKINGRSENLLKYKDFQDIALPIIDITENDANPKHGTPWFELKGKKFKTGVKLSHEEREDLLTNKKDYLNKTAEIRYFELSEEGIPRFGVMVGMRLDK